MNRLKKVCYSPALRSLCLPVTADFLNVSTAVYTHRHATLLFIECACAAICPRRTNETLLPNQVSCRNSQRTYRYLTVIWLCMSELIAGIYCNYHTILRYLKQYFSMRLYDCRERQLTSKSLRIYKPKSSEVFYKLPNYRVILTPKDCSFRFHSKIKINCK